MGLYDIPPDTQREALIGLLPKGLPGKDWIESDHSNRYNVGMNLLPNAALLAYQIIEGMAELSKACRNDRRDDIEFCALVADQEVAELALNAIDRLPDRQFRRVMEYCLAGRSSDIERFQEVAEAIIQEVREDTRNDDPGRCTRPNSYFVDKLLSASSRLC